MLAGWRKGWRGCVGAAVVPLVLLVLVLLLLAIVARQLLRQGRRLALHLVAGGEAHPVPPGYRGVELTRGPGSWQGLRAGGAPTA